MPGNEVASDQSVESESVSETDGDYLSHFKINPDTEEDFWNAIYPEDYIDYQSVDSEFYFSYPSDIFNDVTVDDGRSYNEYGKIIEEISFTGSKGSELIYGMYERDKSLSIEETTADINEGEHGSYEQVDDIVVRSDGDMGRIILTGVYDENERFRFYDLFKITDEKVYRMMFIKPKFKDKEEQQLFAYVTENVYRMCGFSGTSKKPRSYQEYLDSL